MTTRALTEELIDIERERLRSLVEVDMKVAAALHADDFLLVHPSGGVWSKEEYLGGIGSGDIDYRRFEPISDIGVMVDGDVAVLRYRSVIDVAVRGQRPGMLDCWHLDCYRRGSGAGSWQVRWSQATAIEPGVSASEA